MNLTLLCRSVFVCIKVMLMVGSATRQSTRSFELYSADDQSHIGYNGKDGVGGFHDQAPPLKNLGISPLLVSDFISVYRGGFQSRTGTENAMALRS